MAITTATTAAAAAEAGHTWLVIVPGSRNVDNQLYESLRLSINVTTTTLFSLLKQINGHFLRKEPAHGFEYFDEHFDYIWVSRELEFVAFLKFVSQFPWKAMIFLVPTKRATEHVNLGDIADRYKEKEQEKEKDTTATAAALKTPAPRLTVPLVDDFDIEPTSEIELAAAWADPVESHFVQPMISPPTADDNIKSQPILLHANVPCHCTSPTRSNFCRCFQAEAVTLLPKILSRDSQRLVVAWKWKNIGTVAWPASATLLCLSSRGAEMRVRIPTVWASKISDWISIELDIAALPIYERELYFQMSYLYEAVETQQSHSWRLQRRFGTKISMLNPFYLTTSTLPATPIPLLGRLKSWF